MGKVIILYRIHAIAEIIMRQCYLSHRFFGVFFQDFQNSSDHRLMFVIFKLIIICSWMLENFLYSVCR